MHTDMIVWYFSREEMRGGNERGRKAIGEREKIERMQRK